MPNIVLIPKPLYQRLREFYQFTQKLPDNNLKIHSYGPSYHYKHTVTHTGKTQYQPLNNKNSL